MHSEDKLQELKRVLHALFMSRCVPLCVHYQTLSLCRVLLSGLFLFFICIMTPGARIQQSKKLLYNSLAMVCGDVQDDITIPVSWEREYKGQTDWKGIKVLLCNLLLERSW